MTSRWGTSTWCATRLRRNISLAIVPDHPHPPVPKPTAMVLRRRRSSRASEDEANAWDNAGVPCRCPGHRAGRKQVILAGFTTDVSPIPSPAAREQFHRGRPHRSAQHRSPPLVITFLALFLCTATSSISSFVQPFGCEFNCSARHDRHTPAYG